MKLSMRLLTACLVPLTGCGSEASEPPPGASRPIVFQSLATNATCGDIWTVQADGTRLTNLTNTPALCDVTPAVSRDGQRIAFASDGPPIGLHVMNADGTNRHALGTADNFDQHPAWSPDGTRLAFESSSRGSAAEIWIMNSDGTGARRVVTPGRWPTWSADGQQLAYEGSDCQIWLVRIDGSNAHPVRPGGCTADTLQYQPAWSPDGRQIATSSDVGVRPGARGRRILLMTPTGALVRGVTTGAQDQAPAWAPDGRLLAFVRAADPQSTAYLFVVGADGTQSQPVTQGLPQVARPAW